MDHRGPNGTLKQAELKSPAPLRLALTLLGTALLTTANGSIVLLLGPYLRSRGLGEGLIGLVLAASGMAALLVRLPAGIAY